MITQQTEEVDMDFIMGRDDNDENRYPTQMRSIPMIQAKTREYIPIH